MECAWELLEGARAEQGRVSSAAVGRGAGRGQRRQVEGGGGRIGGRSEGGDYGGGGSRAGSGRDVTSAAAAVSGRPHGAAAARPTAARVGRNEVCGRCLGEAEADFSFDKWKKPSEDF